MHNTQSMPACTALTHRIARFICAAWVGDIELPMENEMSVWTKSSFALALSLGLALTAVAAPSAMARTAHRAGYNAQAFAPGVAGQPDGLGGVLISNQRAEALRECNAIANRFSQQTWGVQQNDAYRACMTQRGEVE